MTPVEGSYSPPEHSRGRPALELALLVAAAALPLLVPLADRPLLPFDESLYCRATADMAARGQWLYPTDGGQFWAWYGKPPLVNWLQGIVTSAAGWSVFTLRLPTALGMLVLVVLIWATGRLLAGPRVGALAACLALLSPSLISTGRQIWLEDLVAPAFAGAILLYAWGVGRRRRTELLAMAGSGVVLGLGILTKQSFGLFAAAAIGATELVLRRPGVIRRLAVGAAALLATSAWWFAWTYASVGRPALESWVGYHIVARFAESLEGHTRNANDFARSVQGYMYVLPWAIGALGWIRARPRDPDDASARALFTAWSSLAVLVYLVVGVTIRTFLPWYQVVIMAPLFIGAAYVVIEAADHGEPRWVRWLLPVALIAALAEAVRIDAVAMTAIIVGVGFLAPRAWVTRLRPWLGPPTWIAVSGLLALGIAHPRFERDWRSRLTAAVPAGAPVVIVAPDPDQYPWGCHLHEAPSEAYPGDCARTQPMLQGARYAILQGEARACAPSGARQVAAAEKAVLVELSPEGAAPPPSAETSDRK